jgi:hypothetical protein
MLLERIVAADAVPSVDMFCFNNELSQVAIALAINTNKTAASTTGCKPLFNTFCCVHTTRLRTKALSILQGFEQKRQKLARATLHNLLHSQPFLITKPFCRKSLVTTVARDSLLHPSSEPPASSEPPCSERHGNDGVKQIALLTLELSTGHTL